MTLFPLSHFPGNLPEAKPQDREAPGWAWGGGGVPGLLTVVRASQSGSPEESAAPRNAGRAASQAGEGPPPLTTGAAPWQPTPLPHVGLPTENRPSRTSAAPSCPQGCGPCSRRWVSKAAGVRRRSPGEGRRAGCPTHGALPTAWSAVARVAEAHRDGGGGDQATR